MYFNFFDIPIAGLPKNSEYYFNVLTFICHTGPGVLGKGIERIEDISKIKDPRPMCAIWFEDSSVPEGAVMVECFDHTVVEFHTKSNTVSWYDMLNFECEKTFSIDPILEDFYDEEEENS